MTEEKYKQWDTTKQQQWAARAYLLYLANITFLPIIGFLLQLILWNSAKKHDAKIAQQHCHQSLLASIISGVLLGCVGLLILQIGGLESPYTWMILILYFTLCHSFLIILGILAWARLNAGKTFLLFHPKQWWGL